MASQRPSKLSARPVSCTPKKELRSERIPYRCGRRLNIQSSQEQSDEIEIVKETSDGVPPELFHQLADFDESEIMNSIVGYSGLDSDSTEEISLESNNQEIVTLQNLFGA